MNRAPPTQTGEIGSKLRRGQTLQEGGDKGVDGGTRGELELYKKHKAVEASLYEKEKEAAAQKAIADGELYAKQKEAEGLIAVAQAQGTYIRTLLGAFGGNYTSFRDYLMINGGMFQEIAKINGEAVKGLQLKISIWIGAGGSGGDVGDGGATKEVTGVYKMLPPLFNTVHEQTGMEQLLTGQVVFCKQLRNSEEHQKNMGRLLERWYQNLLLNSEETQKLQNRAGNRG
ncbi:hypothetical protein L1887_15453 [Cichorium endivia]|nr:hypothetical protein L1887_15453 [Cichorium endivia]